MFVYKFHDLYSNVQTIFPIDYHIGLLLENMPEHILPCFTDLNW